MPPEAETTEEITPESLFEDLPDELQRILRTAIHGALSAVDSTYKERRGRVENILAATRSGVMMALFEEIDGEELEDWIRKGLEDHQVTALLGLDPEKKRAILRTEGLNGLNPREIRILSGMPIEQIHLLSQVSAHTTAQGLSLGVLLSLSTEELQALKDLKNKNQVEAYLAKRREQRILAAEEEKRLAPGRRREALIGAMKQDRKEAIGGRLEGLSEEGLIFVNALSDEQLTAIGLNCLYEIVTRFESAPKFLDATPEAIQALGGGQALCDLHDKDLKEGLEAGIDSWKKYIKDAWAGRVLRARPEAIQLLGGDFFSGLEDGALDYKLNHFMRELEVAMQLIDHGKIASVLHEASDRGGEVAWVEANLADYLEKYLTLYHHLKPQSRERRRYEEFMQNASVQAKANAITAYRWGKTIRVSEALWKMVKHSGDLEEAPEGLDEARVTALGTKCYQAMDGQVKAACGKLTCEQILAMGGGNLSKLQPNQILLLQKLSPVQMRIIGVETLLKLSHQMVGRWRLFTNEQFKLIEDLSYRSEIKWEEVRFIRDTLMRALLKLAGKTNEGQISLGGKTFKNLSPRWQMLPLFGSVPPETPTAPFEPQEGDVLGKWLEEIDHWFTTGAARNGDSPLLDDLLAAELHPTELRDAVGKCLSEYSGKIQGNYMNKLNITARPLSPRQWQAVLDRDLLTVIPGLFTEEQLTSLTEEQLTAFRYGLLAHSRAARSWISGLATESFVSMESGEFPFTRGKRFAFRIPADLKYLEQMPTEEFMKLMDCVQVSRFEEGWLAHLSLPQLENARFFEEWARAKAEAERKNLAINLKAAIGLEHLARVEAHQRRMDEVERGPG